MNESTNESMNESMKTHSKKLLNILKIHFKVHVHDMP